MDTHTENNKSMDTNKLPQGNPSKLFEYYQLASSKEQHAGEVKRAALRLLRDAIGTSSFRDQKGNLYQIRERNGEPYLAHLSHDKAITL